MISYLKYRYRLRKLLKQKNDTKKVFKNKLMSELAKESIDKELVKNIQDASRHSLMYIEEQILEAITDRLDEVSKKLSIPLPDFNNDKMWHQTKYSIDKKVLTNEGIKELKSRIKTTNYTWFRQNITGIIALVIAAATAFFAYSQSDIAEKSLKYTTRPYIVVGLKMIDNSKYRFVVSNFGNTPSYYTKIYYDTFTGDSSFIPPKNFKKVNDLLPVIGSNSKGAMTVAEIQRVFHPDTLEALERKKLFAFCSGKIEYEDVFGDKHGYFFCLRKSPGTGFIRHKDFNYPY